MLTNKTDLLDPLSVIIKLFIYSYKPVGTKISVQYNKVTIQEYGLYQSTIRTIMRDTKNDLNILFNPIIHACEIYLNENDRNIYINLFENIIRALDKLKETYTGSDIVYTIDNIGKAVTSFISEDNFSINNVIKTHNNPSYDIKSQIYHNIGKIWTKNKLNILFGFLNELQTYETDEEKEYIIISLSSFMDLMDLCAKNIINSL